MERITLAKHCWRTITAARRVPYFRELRSQSANDFQHRAAITLHFRGAHTLDLTEFLDRGRAHRGNLAQHRIVKDDVGRNALRLCLGRPPVAQCLKQIVRFRTNFFRGNMAIGAHDVGAALAVLS